MNYYLISKFKNDNAGHSVLKLLVYNGVKMAIFLSDHAGPAAWFYFGKIKVGDILVMTSSNYFNFCRFCNFKKIVK